jgi:hypothetical protein
MARYGRMTRDLRRTGGVSGWRRSKQTYKRERSGERRSDGCVVPQARRKQRDRGTGGGSGPGKAAGEGGWEERENQMSNGGEVDQFHESVEGTPQGGPLSPLLSNLVLDELDRELERRSHGFVRYADDCNISVRSERAGQRVMESITDFITTKLKLKVNSAKSAVAKPQERKFLGFSFTGGTKPKRRIAPKARQRFQDKVREITRRKKGASWEQRTEALRRYLRGWRAYFGFCQTRTVLSELDSWVRRRLRCAYWIQWKTGRRRFDALRDLGISRELAANTAGSNRGPWYLSQGLALSQALSNALLRLHRPSKIGCQSVAQPAEPPYTDPYVRWCDRESG